MSSEPGTASARLAPQVYTVVRLIPPGRVVSYGDLAAMFEVNPRLIGRIMAISDGHSLPWWRVLNSYGDLPSDLLRLALPHWQDEGIALKPNGLGCRIRRHRAELGELADAAERALGPLPGLSG